MDEFNPDPYARTWTVGRLIEELSKHDPGTTILSEGCDCLGTVMGVAVRDDHLLITRLPVDVSAEELPEIRFA